MKTQSNRPKPDFISHPPFIESQLASCPIVQFQAWLTEARSVDSQRNLDGACLSTVGEDGYPDARWVLVRTIDHRGFGFYSNAHSAKGRALAKLPRASLAFYWPFQGKQVRIKGDVEFMSSAESDDYFYSRPVGSQIAAIVSNQSAVMSQRSDLLDEIKQFESELETSGQVIKRPDHWIGYRLVPIEVEFWVEQAFRVHDRLVYTRSNQDSWDIKRLYP